MASEWATLPLGDLCLKITDGAHSSPPSVQLGKQMASVKDLTRFGVNLKDARHISESDFELLVKQGCQPQVGDVLIAKDGNSALDTTCLVKEPLDAVLLSSVAILRPNPEKLIPEFLKQHLSSQKTIEYLKSEFISGAAIPRVILKDFKRAIINVPPLKEQRAIAHILGTLDDKIELNRKQNETLEAMARALFKAWFVDFEPVRAKLEGRWQRGHSLPGLPAHLYDLFPDRLVDSELGEIPEGWHHSTIGEEVTVCGGSTPSTKEPEFWDGGQHCWATPKDLSALKFPVLLDTDRRITDAGLAKLSSGLLPVGTVLLSSRAPIGYLAIAEVPTAINQGFIAMKCDGVLPNVFVLQWCRESMDAIVGNANGSTFQEISKSNFRPIPVVMPSEPVLASFAQSADSFYRQMVENERESRSLAQLRDTLLPKLISGELRVKGA
ncbi:MAG TPA: restriction endonuclease subunit S [Rhodocyclaceae bacterium]|nr:restriction endonuclease subunit S [Rhodocyclaceae bacterium]